MCGHEYIKSIKACHAYFDEIDHLKGLFLFNKEVSPHHHPLFKQRHTKTLPDTIR